MLATAKWNGQMSFTGVADSGFPVSMDAEESVGGQNSAVRPMELLAIALAGCTGMDVISILKKKRQNVRNFEVKVEGPRSREHPKVFMSAVVRYIVVGKDIEEEAVARAIELSASKYCPVQAMLEKAFPMKLKYEIYEEGTEPRLIKEGLVELTKI
jgi:putative redox protein